MKKVLKMLPVYAIALALFSCSTEEETVETSALELELSQENSGVLEVGSTTYIFKKSGETAKFNEDNLQFDFRFTQDLNFTIQENTQKHAGGELLITNPETDEFIRVFHIEQLGVRTVQFDVELSNGQNYDNVVLETAEDIASNSGKWHDDPALEMESSITGAFIEPTQSQQCSAAVAACEKSQGRATIVLTHSKSWFTPAQACEVECN